MVVVKSAVMEQKETKRLETIAKELEKRKKQHQEGGARSRRIRRWLRRVLMMIALIFLGTSVVFFINFFRLNSDLIEGHIKQGIIPNLTQGRFHLHVGAISGNLFYGVELENILIQNPHFESGSTVLTVPKASLKYSLFDILFGKLVLQKLEISNPVLYLQRDKGGRGVWDFSTGQEPGDTGKETRWQKQDRAQTVADRYLSDIKINNLSILVPAPDTLIRDEFAARVIQLPAKTWQLDGININLKKHPGDKFVTHLLRLSLPQKPDYMRFHLTRLKSNGNFTVNFDGLGQNFNFAVDNLGQDGRKINLFDGRHRERLNLEWVWGRHDISLVERIRGLNGIIHISEINELVKGWLPTEFNLAGMLKIRFECQNQLPLYDAHFDLEIASGAVNLPFVPIISNIFARLNSSERHAKVEHLGFKLADIDMVHTGYFNYADAANIGTGLQSDLSGDKMALVGTYSRIVPGTHALAAEFHRNSGSARLSFKRVAADKRILYSDFDFAAGIVADGSAADIVPVNLLPADIKKALDSYLSRVDIIGPLNISTSFPSTDDWKTSTVEIDMAGARIVNKLNASDCVTLDGKATLEEGSLRLKNLSAHLDELVLVTSGTADLIAEKPFVKDYQLAVKLALQDARPFSIEAKRLQASLGLAHCPDFDSIELQGEQLVNAEVNSQNNSNFLALNIKKLRFLRRGKALWADDLKAELLAGAFNFAAGEKPQKVDFSAAMELFGIPLTADMNLNLVDGLAESISLKGGGPNFSRIFAAMKTQPEGREFLKKYPIDLSGNFNFALLGSGNLQKPKLDGWLKFPSLNLQIPGLTARLPFHIQLKTDAQTYEATVKAGDASMKVKDVTFNLSRTSADLQISELFAKTGPVVEVDASTGIFGAQLKAKGKILPGKKRIDSMSLSCKSSKIETLAAEIARIGTFKIPFTLSGAFSAAAHLHGPFSNPSSSGRISFSKIGLDFPLIDGKNRAVLKARDFSGKGSFKKRSDKYFGVDVDKFSGKLLGADVSVSGKAHLANLSRGFKPVIDSLSAKIDNLSAKDLYEFLGAGLIPENIKGGLKVNGGNLSGEFSLAGTPDRLLATGAAKIAGGSAGFSALKDEIKDLNGELGFEGRTDSGYSRISAKNWSAKFGRSLLSIPSGFIEDPTRSGKLLLNGSFDKVFPADLLKMLGGMEIAALKFPEEGWLTGNVVVDGSIGSPRLDVDVSTSEMVVEYDSQKQVFTLPLGKSRVQVAINPESGEAQVKMASIGILNGKVNVDSANGRFLPSKPFTMKLNGTIEGVDFSKLQMSDNVGFKGILGGTFKAGWDGKDERDAVFNLEFSDVYIPQLPLVEPETVGSVGIDFIEKPDLRMGQLNFYVTSDEEDIYKGKLLIADGLFAGPHLRIEIGNSEFDPMALQLQAKMMINPQSLRQTSIGRKMKKWTVTAQDRKTGVPFVDLSLTGTWDKPELMSRQVKKRAERRVKRNFIGRIFGGHRPHKASVEELMQWFPGWKKGQ